MNEIFDNLSGMYRDLTGTLSVDQVLLVATALLVLVIVLLIVISGMGRRHEDEMEELGAAKQYDEDALRKRIAELEQQLSQKDARVSFEPPRAQPPVDADAPSGEIKPAYEERMVRVEGANEEAARLLTDARARAYAITRQAEQLYVDTVLRANAEASFIHAKASECMAHAHDTLKQANQRAGEIVDAAHRASTSRDNAGSIPPEA